MAVAASGAQTPAMPKPSTPIGTRISQVALSGVITSASHSTAAAVTAKPAPVIRRGCTRSVNLPTTGAMTIDIAAIGTISSAASVGGSPRTSWA